MAENTPSELRDFLEEEKVFGAGRPISFEGEVATGRGHAK
jgi:hypothetical protein